MRHANAHGRLAAFVLVELDQARDFLHIGALKAVGNQRLYALVVFHVTLNDRVQHLISRQAVLVFLVGAQLGAGWASDDALRDRLAARPIRIMKVAPAGQVKHAGLDHVLDDREAARHVAIQRAVARGHLALVAGGQDNRTGLVGQRHEQRAANAGLDVLFGGVFFKALKLRRQRLLEAIEQRRDRDLVIPHVQALDHVTRIDPTDVGRIGRRHHDRVDVVGTDRVHRNRQHQRRVDAARQAQNCTLETVFP